MLGPLFGPCLALQMIWPMWSLILKQPGMVACFWTALTI